MTFRAMDLMIDAVIRQAGGKAYPCKKCSAGRTFRCSTLKPGCRSKTGQPTKCNPASTHNSCASVEQYERELALLMLDLDRVRIEAEKAA